MHLSAPPLPRDTLSFCPLSLSLALSLSFSVSRTGSASPSSELHVYLSEVGMVSNIQTLSRSLALALALPLPLSRALAPRGGVPRQGVELTDFQSLA